MPMQFSVVIHKIEGKKIIRQTVIGESNQGPAAFRVKHRVHADLRTKRDRSDLTRLDQGPIEFAARRTIVVNRRKACERPIKTTRKVNAPQTLLFALWTTMTQWQIRRDGLFGRLVFGAKLSLPLGSS